MLNLCKNVLFNSRRTYKNFGHKPEPPALFTTIWHGFLTFTFIGAALDWKRLATFFFGEAHGVDNYPWNVPPSPHALDSLEQAPTPPSPHALDSLEQEGKT